VELLDTLQAKGDISGIQNLHIGIMTVIFSENPVRPLIKDLDRLGFPDIIGKNIYYIHNGKLVEEDPQLKLLTYETTASKAALSTAHIAAP
jgi:hypothetical protein